MEAFSHEVKNLEGENPQSNCFDGILSILKEFESDCNKQLDEIEAKISQLSDKFNNSSSEVISPISSTSSIDQTNLNKALQELSSENLVGDAFDFNDSMAKIISEARDGLMSKSPAKKLIEKANRKYVDSLFQRFSTEITAQVIQKVVQRQSSIEDEIDQIDKELNELKENAVKEFAEMRAAIKEIKGLQRMQIEAEIAMNARQNGQRKYRGKRAGALLRKDSVRLLRPKTSFNKDMGTDLTLLPRK